MTSETPIVFVHGLFGPFNDREAFAAVGPGRCSAPDLDGYGATAGRPVSMDGQVKALRTHAHTVGEGEPVHLVAHSIGAIYAFALADAEPTLVSTVTTVEGNFTLEDAFWSASVAALNDGEAKAQIETWLNDPVAFLKADGIPTIAAYLTKAMKALAYQPWRSVWESASVVVETTSNPDYEAMLRRVFAQCPVHLVAGERTAAGWHVPTWAKTAAASDTVITNVGHMMMLEAPRRFGNTINQLLRDT